MEADDVAENDRSSLGHADIAGVGETEGEGEESLVKGGDAEALLSVAVDELMVRVNSSCVPGSCIDEEGKVSDMAKSASRYLKLGCICFSIEYRKGYFYTGLRHYRGRNMTG